MPTTKCLFTASFRILLIFILFCNNVSSSKFIASQETCRTGINKLNSSNKTCFNCGRKNGFLECSKKGCSSIEGCYQVKNFKKGDCCLKCQGCTMNNTYYYSGTNWIDPANPKMSLTCIAGVITKSFLNCYTPCDKPIPPLTGQICSTCPGCEFENEIIDKETLVMPERDPCVSCFCQSGSLMCKKKVCPVLYCPASKIKHKKGDCCPQCQGIGQHVKSSKGHCIFGPNIYSPDEQFSLDTCTNCTCINSTIICDKQNCPVLSCEKKNQKLIPGQCCYRCENSTSKPNFESGEMIDENYDEQKEQQPNKKHLEKYCKYEDGIIYRNGESWNTTTCETCTCIEGKINCMLIVCPEVTCPPGLELESLGGSCCKTCTQSEGVCSVLRGTQFRTFDGKYYEYIGSCSYVLVHDYDTKMFNVRLKINLVEFNAFVKKVSLKLSNIKIDIQSNKKIKVDGRIVSLPFYLHNSLSIEEKNKIVSVITKIGIKIEWNYKSILKLTVSKNFRNKLCGLCGNFNSDPNDDMTTSHNILVDDPTIFAQSWSFNDNECLKNNIFARPTEED